MEGLGRGRRGSVLEAPFQDRAALDGAEDHVLDHEADQDHREEAGEDRRDFKEIAVLEDEPAEPALPR